jgi:hypothetical protein
MINDTSLVFGRSYLIVVTGLKGLGDDWKENN